MFSCLKLELSTVSIEIQSFCTVSFLNVFKVLKLYKTAPKPVFIEASDGDEELGFSLRLRVPTWWVVPTRTEWVRWPSKIFQHRNSVLPRQFLADQNGGCDSRGHCDIFMKKYLKRAKYFSEKSLENFEIFADVHPKYSWNLTGKKISAEFSRFYKDNSTARFSKYK